MIKWLFSLFSKKKTTTEIVRQQNKNFKRKVDNHSRSVPSGLEPWCKAIIKHPLTCCIMLEDVLQTHPFSSNGKRTVGMICLPTWLSLRLMIGILSKNPFLIETKTMNLADDERYIQACREIFAEWIYNIVNGRAARNRALIDCISMRVEKRACVLHGFVPLLQISSISHSSTGFERNQFKQSQRFKSLQSLIDDEIYQIVLSDDFKWIDEEIPPELSMFSSNEEDAAIGRMVTRSFAFFEREDMMDICETPSLDQTNKRRRI